jgi:hypothetical protein
VPELDYVLLADYVRQENGFIHVMAAGVDTISVPSLPWIQPLGIAVRLSFGPTDQPGDEHTLAVSITGPAEPVLDRSAAFATPERPADVPAHWKTGLGIALQPLTSYGHYSCELDIDSGAITKTIGLRVVPEDGPAELAHHADRAAAPV